VTTNMTALFRSSDEQVLFFHNRASEDHRAAYTAPPPPSESRKKPVLHQDATTTTITTLVFKRTVTRIECQTHRVEHDPNHGRVDDPNKWVENTEPPF